MDLTKIKPFYPLYESFEKDLSPEEKLVILFSRLHLSSLEKQEADPLISSGGIDWDNFLKIVFFHDIMTLAYSHIQLFREKVPDFVMNFLREEAAGDLAINSNLLRVVDILSKTLKTGNITHVFTKGVTLVMDVYKDPSLRSFSDIDIIIDPGDFPKMDEVLAKAGFSLCEGDRSALSYRSQSIYVFENKFYIDVHRGFIGRMLHNKVLGINEKEVLNKRRKVSLGTHEVNALSVVDDLLYQCLHLSMHHSFFGFKWYTDIFEFINKYGEEIDWSEFVKYVKNSKVRRPVYYVLLFLRNMYSGVKLPEEVLAGLNVRTTKLDKWLFKKLEVSLGSIDYLTELVMFDSMRDAIKFITLSFFAYPQKIGHYFKVVIKALKQLILPKRNQILLENDV